MRGGLWSYHCNSENWPTARGERRGGAGRGAVSSSSSEKLGASSSVHYTAALQPAVEQELRGERSLEFA